ncbi:MAG TPA: CbiX/SirB N-terminal domain-containing protein [Pseudomonadales bacterium]|nr:cobalamin biosynthesis protein CbiX [Gammaproteobacteria bacterium]HUH58130.1 CbiX/SirB N-terminal domain-containing protein [Pseudomonadales bacterium]
MKRLLIVAHGSRRDASNDEVRVLAEKVAEHLQLPANDVQVAFLELALPSIETALDECFSSGTQEVCVLPYFLSSGTHVVNDVPREIAAAQTKWPDKTITLLPHIGAADTMIGLIANSYR